MNILKVPISNNALLENVNDSDLLAEIELYHNSLLDLVSNKRFDHSLIQYTKQYDQSQAYSARFRLHMQEVLKIVKSKVPIGAKVVEIGCGHGHFIEMLQEDRHFSDVTGFDAIYSGTNPSIHARYLTKDDRIEADIVVIRHVVEHVTDPYAFLSMLKTIFGNPIVYIEVPNYEWITNTGKFYEIFYEHVHYFKQSTFHHLFSEVLTSGIFFDDQYLYALASLEHLNPQFFDAFHEPTLWHPIQINDLFETANTFFSNLRYHIDKSAKIYVWGAASEGCMILLYLHRYDFANQIGYAVDINPNKYGKLLPITKTPILRKQDFFKDVQNNDVLIVSNEAYLEEISKEIAAMGLNISILEHNTIHNWTHQNDGIHLTILHL